MFDLDHPAVIKGIIKVCMSSIIDELLEVEEGKDLEDVVVHEVGESIQKTNLNHLKLLNHQKIDNNIQHMV